MDSIPFRMLRCHRGCRAFHDFTRQSKEKYQPGDIMFKVENQSGEGDQVQLLVTWSWLDEDEKVARIIIDFKKREIQYPTKMPAIVVYKSIATFCLSEAGMDRETPGIRLAHHEVAPFNGWRLNIWSVKVGPAI